MNGFDSAPRELTVSKPTPADIMIAIAGASDGNGVAALLGARRAGRSLCRNRRRPIRHSGWLAIQAHAALAKPAGLIPSAAQMITLAEQLDHAYRLGRDALRHTLAAGVVERGELRDASRPQWRGSSRTLLSSTGQCNTSRSRKVKDEAREHDFLVDHQSKRQRRSQHSRPAPFHCLEDSDSLVAATAR